MPARSLPVHSSRIQVVRLVTHLCHMAQILGRDPIAVRGLSVSDLSRISHVAIQLRTLCLLLLMHVTGTTAPVIQTTQI